MAKMRGRIMEKLGKAVGDIVAELGPEKGSLLAILLAVQDASPESYVSEEAVNEMLEKTNTSYAPWHILESNDKKYARIKALKTVIEAIEKYEAK